MVLMTKQILGLHLDVEDHKLKLVEFLYLIMEQQEDLGLVLEIHALVKEVVNPENVLPLVLEVAGMVVQLVPMELPEEVLATLGTRF